MRRTFDIAPRTLGILSRTAPCFWKLHLLTLRVRCAAPTFFIVAPHRTQLGAKCEKVRGAPQPFLALKVRREFFNEWAGCDALLTNKRRRASILIIDKPSLLEFFRNFTLENPLRIFKIFKMEPLEFDRVWAQLQLNPESNKNCWSRMLMWCFYRRIDSFLIQYGKELP